MRLGGIQPLTLLDYPGKVAATIFTQGCNLRCPYCHNASLVHSDGESRVEEEEVLEYLSKRKGLLDGVCISGGEPLMQKDIFSFLDKIKKMGFLIKLDTNGTFPQRLQRCVRADLVDMVALDLKHYGDRYKKAVGKFIDHHLVLESLAFLQEQGICHEVRTTVVGNLHTVEDIASIAKIVGSRSPYYLQPYRHSERVLSPDHLEEPDATFMKKALASAQVYAPQACIRGFDL